MNEPFIGGAPPPSLSWQMGKTAASIAFVNLAENFLALDDDDIGFRFERLLRKQIELVKNGDLVLTQFIDEV